MYPLLKLGIFFYNFIIYAPLLGCALLLLLFSLTMFFYSLIIFFKKESTVNKQKIKRF